MAVNTGAAAVAGRRRHRRRPVMAEINVTPMVDVMLVLLIIFMVSAPLLTVGVPIDLPQTQAKSLDQDKEPLAISVNVKGQVYLQETEIGVDELVHKLKAITEARGGLDGARRSLQTCRHMEITAQSASWVSAFSGDCLFPGTAN